MQTETIDDNDAGEVRCFSEGRTEASASRYGVYVRSGSLRAWTRDTMINPTTSAVVNAARAAFREMVRRAA